MEAVDIGRLLGQFVMDAIIGIIVVFLIRGLPPMRKRPALPYWVGATASLLMGFLVINKSLDTVIVSALAGCCIVLRHYLTLKPTPAK